MNLSLSKTLAWAAVGVLVFGVSGSSAVAAVVDAVGREADGDTALAATVDIGVVAVAVSVPHHPDEDLVAPPAVVATAGCGRVRTTSERAFPPPHVLEKPKATLHLVAVAVTRPRFLQTVVDIASACSAEGDAVVACANSTLSLQENLDCESCIVASQNSSSAQDLLRTRNFTCDAYTSFVCDALEACPCSAPCSQQLSDFQECVLLESFSQAGVPFECNITCDDSSSGGGGGGGGGNTGGTSDGRLTSYVTSAVAVMVAATSFLPAA